MSKDLIGYEQIIQNAMRGVVREALRRVQLKGLPPGHQLFLTFRTDRDDVELPDSVRATHPREITVVLQNQFWDLEVDERAFSVMLSFNKAAANVVVPFDALLGFADPGANFGLQFRGAGDPQALTADGAPAKDDSPKPGAAPVVGVIEANRDPGTARPVEPARDEKDGDANVVSFDKFKRK